MTLNIWPNDPEYFVEGLRFGHLLTVQRICHSYEGCNVEPAGTGKDSSSQRCSGIPASHRPGCRDHGSERTPHQAPPRRLPQARSRRTSPWEPGPKTSQRRRRSRCGCRGEAGQQRLRPGKPQPLHRVVAGARGDRPEPTHGAPDSGQGRHRQSSQPPLPATPVPAPAHAPGGHAGADRRQQPSLAGGPGTETDAAHRRGRRHRHRGPGRFPYHRGHPWLPGAHGRADPAVGYPPGPIQRPPRCLQVQRPSEAGGC